MQTRLFFNLIVILPLFCLPRLIPTSAAEEYRSDRIIIKPRAGGAANLHAALGIRVIRAYPRFGGIQVLQLPAGAAVEQARAAYENSGLVEYAVFDHIYNGTQRFPIHEMHPNDPDYDGGGANNQLWGMHNTGQNGGTSYADIDAPEGWH